MNPIAYMNGDLIAASDLRILPQDSGFMQGVTVAEQLRTFNGHIFELEQHFQRFQDGLAVTQIDLDIDQLRAAMQEVVAHNYQSIDSGSDMGITVFATPGSYATYRREQTTCPTVCVHTYPLPFGLWAEKYSKGQECEIVSVRQVSPQCWPRSLKCRSRMHYYLGDLEAQARNPNAKAIFLDENGFVTEASTANVLGYSPEVGLISPPAADILAGVSLHVTFKLAQDIGIPVVAQPLSPDILESATEILFTSTPYCLLPVSKLGNREFHHRDCFQRLLAAWNEMVGLDLLGQAVDFS